MARVIASRDNEFDAGKAQPFKGKLCDELD
jgi:hypothetical protein